MEAGVFVPGGAPVGAVVDFAGAGTPPGVWLECNGQNVSRTDYAALFAAIGTTWGAGDGSTTFTLPDLRRKTTVGAGGAGTGTLGNAVGDTGGAETHTLAESEIPAHTHSGTAASAGAHTHSITGSSDGGANMRPVSGRNNSGSLSTSSAGSHSHSLTINNAGGGGGHNNLQPSAVVKKLIKAA
nr:microcystin dependent protein [Moraxellaceae bacterium]